MYVIQWEDHNITYIVLDIISVCYPILVDARV